MYIHVHVHDIVHLQCTMYSTYSVRQKNFPHTHTCTHARTHTHTHSLTHTQNTGIVVMMMLIASCICCVGFVGLCCGELPSVARIIGAVCLLIAAIAAVLYCGQCIIYTHASLYSIALNFHGSIISRIRTVRK